MSSENLKASLPPKLDDDIESQNDEMRLQKTGERIGINIRKSIVDLKQLKSFQILKSAFKIFTSNMLFMILSILPLFGFMVFYEIKLQKSVSFLSSNQLNMSPKYITIMQPYNSTSLKSNATSNSLHKHQVVSFDNTTYTNQRREFFINTLQFLLFYLLIYPFLELVSLSLTTKIASKIEESQKPATLRELFYQRVNLGGPFITYICVHILSLLSLLGFCWIILLGNLFSVPSYYYGDSTSLWYVVLVIIQSVMFLALLYKYLDWSAFWNMGIVISCTEEQTGVAALVLSEYYGRHCRKTGFQLMLGFFVFGNVLRVPCLYAGLFDGSVAGVVITCVVIMSVSIGNLVKWVAFLLYFEYCKQQVMDKKVDDDHKQGKTAENLS